MTRILAIASAMALVATAAAAVTLARSDGASAQVPLPIPPLPGAPPAAPGVPQQLVLRVGDTLRVEGAPMGCQVTQRGGRPAIECRRDGTLKGTYGTFISDRSVTVARFRSSRTAQTILTATHGGGWRACTSRARTASVSRACR